MAQREDEAERFWDERAKENALYFVDNTLDYGEPDEQDFWNGGEEALDQMLAAVGQQIAPHETVVDIGCGVGRMARALAKRTHRVIAIDVSEEMLSRGRALNAHLQNIEWVHGDGRTLRPIEDASVDGCFSHVVFQHLPDPELTLGYIREMGRVLRPGGWAVFQISTNPAVHAARPGVRERLKGTLKRGPRGLTDPAWLGSAVDLDALRKVAAENRLAVGALTDPGSQYTLVGLRRTRDASA